MSNKPDFQKAYDRLAENYIRDVIAILFFQEKKTLDTVCQKIQTPNGGVYNLTLRHESGPKINVTKTLEKKIKP